ncbi:unnamed protein product, partial [Dibothriocephalus latus]
MPDNHVAGLRFRHPFQPTKSIGQEDALSCFIYFRHTDPGDIVILSHSFEAEDYHLFMDSVRALSVMFEEVRNATQQDPLLRQVISSCTIGEMIVVTQKLQARVLRQFHNENSRVNRIKALADIYVYWPYMNQQLDQPACSCIKCALASMSSVKTTIKAWPVLEATWSTVYIDYAVPFNSQNFRIAVKAYSKWPEVILMEL